mmetsp:Transcript_52345/g.59830  ORF Transcript_52345/g.59830 Transcript_52345/m.59830 type:complete len:150 (-) Transcript_52345:19-468(-)
MRGPTEVTCGIVCDTTVKMGDLVSQRTFDGVGGIRYGHSMIALFEVAETAVNVCFGVFWVNLKYMAELLYGVIETTLSVVDKTEIVKSHGVTVGIFCCQFEMKDCLIVVLFTITCDTLVYMGGCLETISHLLFRRKRRERERDEEKEKP